MTGATASTTDERSVDGSAGRISRPPTGGDRLRDRLFRGTATAFAAASVLTLVSIVVLIGFEASSAIGKSGLEFLGETSWDPARQTFGILPQVFGTLYSSILALVIATIFGLAIAIFLSQDFLPHRLEVMFKNIVELLAAIPSVVYGLWGIYVVIPAVRGMANWLHDNFEWIPFFNTPMTGPSKFPASVVLAIMVLPTISALSRDALSSVPTRIREAAFGMGATKWEVILTVVVPTAASGIFASVILGFGRALGETMALAMLVGNSNEVSWSLFSPGNTLAALLANQFPEAGPGLEISSLMYAALVLLLITLVVNILGSLVLQRATRRLRGVA